MEQIITFTGILSAITIALTEVIKRTNTIPKNIIPLIANTQGGNEGAALLKVISH